MQIVIGDGGSCEFTRSPELLSLLHPADMKSIERMTDIQFDTELQRFYVRFLRGPHKGSNLAITLNDYTLFASEYGGFEDDFKLHTERFGLLTWGAYEEAVRAEIRYVEFLRDLGHTMV